MQVLHVGSIAAVEKRSQSKSRIGVLAGHLQIPEWVTIVDRADYAGERIPATHYLALFVPYDRQNKAETMKRGSFLTRAEDHSLRVLRGHEMRKTRKEPWRAR